MKKNLDRLVASFSPAQPPLPCTSGFPKPVKGYSSAELGAMTVNEKVKPGVSKWDLDTPALCVDLDKMEKNIATMQAALKKFGLPSRPHAKTHKCAAIAKYQLATGSIGICCAKLSEAEAMVAHGVDKILMTTSNPSASKIRRAMELQEVPPRLHPGRRRGAERARPLRRRERGGRRRGRRHRRRGRDAQRHPSRGWRGGARPADRQAAEPQAARHALVRRRRAAREGIREPQGARARRRSARTWRRST